MHTYSFLATSDPAISTTLLRIHDPFRFWAQPDRWRSEQPALHRRRSVYWTWRFTCQTPVLPPVGYSFNLQLSGKHRDATGSAVWWRTTSNSACFTNVPTGLSSRCRTIARWSLWTRKLDAQFFFKIRQLEVQGNLTQCFQARVSCTKTHVSIEINFLWNINRFQGVVSKLPDSRRRQIVRCLFDGTGITCMLKRDLNSRSRKRRWNLVRRASENLFSSVQLEDAHSGFDESRREQFRRQEELVMQEKSVRDAQIRCNHEIRELKNYESTRSLHEFWGSRDTIQRLILQIQELQE